MSRCHAAQILKMIRQLDDDDDGNADELLIMRHSAYRHALVIS